MSLDKFQRRIKDSAAYLARPDLVFYALPWLMVILTIGTLAQKEIGLYQAHQQYFSTWLIWLGPVPLPGAYPTLGAITLSLAIKFFFKSPWGKTRAGTWLTHLGILALLIGGLLTAMTQREGFIVLEEGSSTQLVSDYHERVITIVKNEQIVETIKFNDIQKDQAFSFNGITAEILQRCENCLPAFVEPSAARKGMAAKVRLTSILPEVQNELNLSGATLKISGMSQDVDGIYILMETMSPKLNFNNGTESYSLNIGRKERSLPFKIELKDFEKDMHPATQMARSYHSDVLVHDGDLSYPVRIEMNAPLRYKGYTLYQSSFVEMPDGTEKSVLSVVENKGRLFPYLASTILAAGLIVHLIVRTKTILIFIALLLTLPAGNIAKANSPELEMSTFKTLPVLHQGRIKPLDSFARTNLTILKGATSYNGQPAINWLANTLFDPSEAVNDRVFRIFKATRFDLPDRKQPYYSYAELAPVLAKQIPLIEKILQEDEKNWSNDQKELIALHDASLLYTQLLRSFAAYLPLAVSLPDSLKKEWKIEDTQPATLSDFKRYERRLKNKLKNIIRLRGENPDNYTKEEQDIATFAWSMSLIENAGAQNMLLRILPGADTQSAGHWHSPWALGQEGKGTPLSAAYLESWQKMIAAYRDGNAKTWEKETQQTKELIKKNGHYTSSDLHLEIFYNSLHPLGLALVFYGAAFLVFLLRGLSNTQGNNKKLYAVSFAFLSAGLILNIVAITLRVLILDRPPVGTLYESILFVTAICVFGSLLLEIKRKDALGLLVGSLSGGLLLFVAGSFAGPDTMQVLTAVLNTNFWLTVHVLCITMGYGWCVIAALLAHYYLFIRWRAQTPPTMLSTLAGQIKTFALIALLFTAVGTILGGIWADQSWGRFWGWDPKENGALLIVLWIVWALHGTLSRHLSALGFTVLIAFLNIIVALAWFGVNLLGTGLHSYGFIEGIALGLSLFCAIETLIIAALWLGIKKQEARHHAAQ